MTQITIASFSLPNWQGGPNPVLKVYADKTFLTSDLKRICSEKIGGANWYFTNTGSVAGTNLTIPQFTIDSTTDSDTPAATYSGVLYDSTGSQQLEVLFRHWRIPSTLGNSVSFAQLAAVNKTSVPNQPGVTYSQDQINALMAGTEAQAVALVTALLASYYTQTQANALLLPKIGVVTINDADILPYNVLASQSGTYFITDGALAAKVFDLPPASAGLFYTFYCSTALLVQIVPATGDSIRIAKTAGVGLVASCGTRGASVTFLAINSTEWVAIAGIDLDDWAVS